MYNGSSFHTTFTQLAIGEYRASGSISFCYREASRQRRAQASCCRYPSHAESASTSTTRTHLYTLKARQCFTKKNTTKCSKCVCFVRTWLILGKSEEERQGWQVALLAWKIAFKNDEKTIDFFSLNVMLVNLSFFDCIFHDPKTFYLRKLELLSILSFLYVLNKI